MGNLLLTNLTNHSTSFTSNTHPTNQVCPWGFSTWPLRKGLFLSIGWMNWWGFVCCWQCPPFPHLEKAHWRDGWRESRIVSCQCVGPGMQPCLTSPWNVLVVWAYIFSPIASASLRLISDSYSYTSSDFNTSILFPSVVYTFHNEPVSHVEHVSDLKKKKRQKKRKGKETADQCLSVEGWLVDTFPLRQGRACLACGQPWAASGSLWLPGPAGPSDVSRPDSSLPQKSSLRSTVKYTFPITSPLLIAALKW